MSRRDRISSLIAEQLAAANSAGDPETARPDTGPRRVAAGPVRTMGLTLDALERERGALEAALAAGAITELDPASIEGSFAADRFAADDDPAFEALKRSIAEQGQEVPILVRPVDGQPGRYQAAYGHRRLKACRALGLPVKAIIRPMSDAALVIAQGLENAERVDLSFIEKASFARALEDRGFERPTIMAALGTDKTELSKMIATARALPEAMARAIGPAPKAGRRRWMKLAELIATAPALARAEAALARPATMALSSDARFLAVLEAASRSQAEAAETAPVRTDITAPDGGTLARVRETSEQLTLVLDRTRHTDFADFLVRELPELYSRFLARGEPPARRR